MIRKFFYFVILVGILAVLMQVGGETFQKAVVAQCGDKRG